MRLLTTLARRKFSFSSTSGKTPLTGETSAPSWQVTRLIHQASTCSRICLLRITATQAACLSPMVMQKLKAGETPGPCRRSVPEDSSLTDTQPSPARTTSILRGCRTTPRGRSEVAFRDKRTCPGIRRLLAALLSSALFSCGCHGADLRNPAPNSFQWARQGSSLVLIQGTEAVGTLVSDSEEGLPAEDNIVPLETGVFRIQRTYVNTLKSVRGRVRLTLDFVIAAKSDFALIPSVMYNGNTWGNGGEPKNWRRDGQWWSF